MKWPEEKNNLARRFRISFSSRKKKGTVQSKGLTDRIVGNPEVMAKVLINAEVHFGPGDFTGLRGGLNGSTQHFPEVYSQESETPKFVEGVDLSAALLCSDPTGNSRSGLCS